MAQKVLAVRFKMEGGKTVEAEIVGLGRKGSAALEGLNRSARSGSGGLQNLGFQVQDFAVQVGAGTSATQALAQQLPQLLSGFGLLGIAIGTASAVAIPLLGMAFGNLREEVLSTDEALKQLEQSTDALAKATEVFSAQGLEGLAAKYGEVSAAVLLLSQRQVELAAQQAKEAARAAAVAFSAEFDAVLGTRRGKIADFLGLELGFVNTREQVEQVLPKIAEFEQALINIQNAASFEEQADAIARMLVILDDTAAKGGEFYQQMVASEAAVRQMAAAGGGALSWIDAAINGASDLAGQLWDAANAAFNITTGMAAAKARADQQLAASLSYGAIQNEFGSGADMAARAAINARAPVTGTLASGAAGVFVPSRRRAGGGGGGGGQSDAVREAARIFEETRTEAEKYAAELERLNMLHADGFLSADTLGRAIEQLGEKTKETKDEAEKLNDTFRDTFESIVTGSATAGEALSSLFSNLASQLANSAFDGLNTALFGDGGIGAAVSGIFGGGRAGGGPVLAGRSYMVGESGPELVTMGGNGFVTPTAALRSAVQGGGGVVINIDARGAVDGVATQIRREMQAVLPAFLQASVGANRAAASRGR